MPEQQKTIGGQLTLGTETPQQDVIDGWNFKVQGAVEGDIGSQALELDGLIPFVQLIGLYDKSEIDRLLGRESSTFQRTVEFIGGDDTQNINDYKENTEEDVRDFEDQIKKNYIKVFLVNENMKEGEGIPKDGIILATNSPQAGNEAYEVINDVGTPKDAGGVGITDLQIETGTKDFLNRRYKLRMTITDPQVLNDKPEYLKLATLQSMFLIIHGWSNPDQLTAWPEQFSPAPIVTNVGSEGFPNGRMDVDMSHKNTGGAWGAALVATTMYDFAFNEIGQLEANFTFMPREISFMHTMRIPVVAPIIQQILNTGEQNEPFDEENPFPKPKSFAGYAKGVGDVISEFGKNLAQVIEEEQAAYAGGVDRNPLSSIFQNISNRTDFSLTDRLANYSDEVGDWADSADGGGIGDYHDRRRRAQAYARFPHAGIGIGTFMSEPVDVIRTDAQANEDTRTYTHYTHRISYYYLGWILEALRFSLWDLNKGKASRGETPYDLKFRYMGVPRNSPLNYAVQDQLSQGLIPSVNNYTAEAIKYLGNNCIPSKGVPLDPPKQLLNVIKYDIFRVVTDSEVGGDAAGDPDDEPTFLQNAGYEMLDPAAAHSNPALDFGDDRPAHLDAREIEQRNLLRAEGGYPLGATNFYDFKKIWSSLTRAEKLYHIPNGDYRKSLVGDPDVLPNPRKKADRGLRIMHPDFENQLLYNVVPQFSDKAWQRWKVDISDHGKGNMRGLNPPEVDITQSYGEVEMSVAVFKLIQRSRAGMHPSSYDAKFGGVPFFRRVPAYDVGGHLAALAHLPDGGSHEERMAALARSEEASLGHFETQRADSLGQGFWSAGGRYVGEGMFAYYDTPWESMVGGNSDWFDDNGANDIHLRGHDKWDMSGAQGMRGDTLKNVARRAYGIRAYGILMPAISARFFSTNGYKSLQQQWYNLHVDYLTDNFSKIITKRVVEGMEKNQRLEDYGAEPVDLFWLTGRKYAHHIRPYTPDELELMASDIIFTSNEIEITRSKKIIDDLTKEYKSIDRRLNGQDPDDTDDTADIGQGARVAFRRDRFKDLLENATTQFLNQPDNKSMFDALNSAEDLMADSILPLYSKKGFWESRIKIILIELVSKDLIKMGNVTFPEDSANQKYTASSVYAAPLEVRKDSLRTGYVRSWGDEKLEYSGDHWIANRIDQPPQQIPTNVFDGIAFLEFYKIVIVKPDLIYDTGEIFSAIDMVPEDLSSEEAGVYNRRGGLNPHEGDVGRIVPNSWADIKRDGAVRYVNWDFSMIYNQAHDALSTYSNYYVGLPDAPQQFSSTSVERETRAMPITGRRGDFSAGIRTWRSTPPVTLPTVWTELNGTKYYPADIVIDKIGAFEVLLEGVRLRRLATDVEERHGRKPVNVEEINSKSRNAYIFMNWVPQSMRDKYALPEEIMMGLGGMAANQDEAIWKQANNQYDQYISNCRALLKKYVSKNKSLDEKIAPLETNKDRMAVRISNSQSTLDTFQESFNNIKGVGPQDDPDWRISPFGADTKFDTNVTISLGGGREMELSGNRAQFYAARWNKKLIFGANDIQNYGPPRGGVYYYDPNSTEYGWRNMGYVSQAGQGSQQGFDETEYIDPATGLINFFPANLFYTGKPIKIAHLLTPEGTVVPPGDAQRDPGSMANEVKNKDRGRTVAQFAAAKQINESELNIMFTYKFDKNITISDPYIITKLLTDRPWPTYMEIGRASEALAMSEEELHERDVETTIASTDPIGMDIETGEVFFPDPDDAPPIIDIRSQISLSKQRWALYIDDDLDFIVPKSHLRSEGFENDNFLDTYPHNWQKLPWRFLSNSEIMIYPRATGARIGIDEHLPNLTEDAIRRLVRTEDNGFSGAAAKQHNIGLPFYYNGQPESKSDDADLPASMAGLLAAGSFAGNPDYAYPDDQARQAQSSLGAGTLYTTAGRPPATPEWPFGVPRNVEIEETEAIVVEEAGQTEVVYEAQQLQAAITTRPSRQLGGSLDKIQVQITETTDGVETGFQANAGIRQILKSLPAEFEEGFMSSVIGADEHFEGGEPLNPGVKKWITNDLINMLPQGRRIGIYSNSTHRDPYDLPGHKGPIRDVVYGDLFSDVPESARSTDFGNKTIENVAEIPIKREVVDNLLNRSNANMSIMQFVQQLITPSSLGVNANVQIAGRNRNGIMELAVASIDYRGMSYDLIKSSEDASMENRQPNNQLLFDYKKRNSLIESIDMSSKMDPAAFLTYQNSSSMIHGPGRDYNILKLLEYEGIAEEFKEYLEGVSQTDNAGTTYSGIVHVGIGNRVTVDRVRYNALSPTILDGFVAQNPERWAKIASMMQGQNNFTTDLLAFYMRSVTLTIHGLTNVEPFNLINVKGVLPSLEGIYIVTNVTDRVTPAGFQTILEGKLLRRKDKNEVSGPAHEVRHEVRQDLRLT